MKRLQSQALAVLILVLGVAILAGCNDETKADPAILKSMNDQRAAMSPEAQKAKGTQQANPGSN